MSGVICQPVSGDRVDYFGKIGAALKQRWPGWPAQNCVLCARPGQRRGLCADCAEQLPAIGPACPGCGLPQQEERLCGDCMRAPPSYDRCLAALDYIYPVNRLLHLAKYRGRLEVLALLTSRLLARLRREDAKPVCIVPVPLHFRRHCRRGYNQAGLIAARLSQDLHIPCRDNVLSRIRATREQSALRSAQRKQNVRGAFRLRRPPACDHIAVVDDVVTTGATGNEIARLLKQAGVARVDIWALARAAAPD